MYKIVHEEDRIKYEEEESHDTTKRAEKLAGEGGRNELCGNLPCWRELRRKDDRLKKVNLVNEVAR